MNNKNGHSLSTESAYPGNQSCCRLLHQYKPLMAIKIITHQSFLKMIFVMFSRPWYLNLEAFEIKPTSDWLNNAV